MKNLSSICPSPLGSVDRASAFRLKAYGFCSGLSHIDGSLSLLPLSLGEDQQQQQNSIKNLPPKFNRGTKPGVLNEFGSEFYPIDFHVLFNTPEHRKPEKTSQCIAPSNSSIGEPSLQMGYPQDRAAVSSISCHGFHESGRQKPLTWVLPHHLSCGS